MPTDADAPDIVWGIKDHDPTIATLPEHKLLRRRLSLKDMSEAVFTEVEKHPILSEYGARKEPAPVSATGSVINHPLPSRGRSPVVQRSP